MHQLMSSGTLEIVYVAVDYQTGEPLAVKELQSKDRRFGSELQLETE